jgi:transcriptional regulator with XRE-family HTH domain
MKSTRILRDILGVSQAAFAEESGVRRASLTMYESGRAFPSRRIAKRLDDALVRIVERRVIDSVHELRRDLCEPGPELPDDDDDDVVVAGQ